MNSKNVFVSSSVFIILVLGGLASSILGALIYISQSDFAKNSLETTATIVDSKLQSTSSTKSRSWPYYVPVIQFTTQEKVEINTVITSGTSYNTFGKADFSTQPYAFGTKITIFYDKNNPKHVEFHKSSKAVYVLAIILTIYGLISLGAGICILTHTFKKRH